MLKIDHRNKKFQISFLVDSNEQFETYLNFCKSIHLFYEGSTRLWECPEKRIDELILWIDKYNLFFSFTPEAEKRFNEIQKEWTTSDIKFYRRVVFNQDLILKENKTLLNFQIEDIKWGLGRNNFNNFNECGIGKTIETLCIFSQRFLNKEIDSVFITVKTGTTLAWKDEILTWSKVFSDEEIFIINNENKYRPFESIQDKKIIICPDHLLSDVFISYKKEIPKSKKNIRFSSTPDIRKLWKKESIFYVHDESHRIKYSDRIRTKQTLALKPFFSFITTLTGTPAINDFAQIYNQLYMVDKAIIGMSENAFKIWVSDEIGTQFSRYQIVSYNSEKVKQLQNKIKMTCIQKLKEDLPEMKTVKVFRAIPLEMSVLQTELYRLISWTELYVIVNDFAQFSFKRVLNKFPYTMSIFDNPLLLKNKQWEDGNIQKKVDSYKIEDDPKFITLKSFLEDYVEERKEKVVVYFCHPQTGDMLFEKFSKYKPLLIHGQLKDVKDKEQYRRKVESDFNNNLENRVAFLSALTSSESINLNKQCRRIIIYECPPSAVEFSQLQDRVWRINNREDAIIDCLYYKNTLDSVRLERNRNRALLNENLVKNIDIDDLKNLLKGIVKKGIYSE